MLYPCFYFTENYFVCFFFLCIVMLIWLIFVSVFFIFMFLSHYAPYFFRCYCACQVLIPFFPVLCNCLHMKGMVFLERLKEFAHRSLSITGLFYQYFFSFNSILVMFIPQGMVVLYHFLFIGR